MFKKNALNNIKKEHDKLCIIYQNNFLEDINAKNLMNDLKQINQNFGR